MKTEIKPFYVGQEVVANCDHNQGAFKKGDEFKITSIKEGCCEWEVTIGVMAPPHFSNYARCQICDNRQYNPVGNEWFFRASRFSPKLEISGFISMKELAEKQLEEIGAN